MLHTQSNPSHFLSIPIKEFHSLSFFSPQELTLCWTDLSSLLHWYPTPHSVTFTLNLENFSLKKKEKKSVKIRLEMNNKIILFLKTKKKSLFLSWILVISIQQELLSLTRHMLVDTNDNIYLMLVFYNIYPHAQMTSFLSHSTSLVISLSHYLGSLQSHQKLWSYGGYRSRLNFSD